MYERGNAEKMSKTKIKKAHQKTAHNAKDLNNLFVIVLSILVYYVFYCVWQINKINKK